MVQRAQSPSSLMDAAVELARQLSRQNEGLHGNSGAIIRWQKRVCILWRRLRVVVAKIIMKILFLENHAVFAQQVIQRFLNAHRVTIVPSLEAARAALRAESFDLILSDYD